MAKRNKSHTGTKRPSRAGMPVRARSVVCQLFRLAIYDSLARISDHESKDGWGKERTSAVRKDASRERMSGVLLCFTRSNKAKQGQTRQNKAKQGQTRQNKVKQGKTRSNKAKQGQTRLNTGHPFTRSVFIRVLFFLIFNQLPNPQSPITNPQSKIKNQKSPATHLRRDRAGGGGVFFSKNPRSTLPPKHNIEHGFIEKRAGPLLPGPALSG